MFFLIGSSSRVSACDGLVGQIVSSHGRRIKIPVFAKLGGM